MKYIVETEKSVNEAVESVREATKKNGFGVISVLDMKETMKSKGVDFDNSCQIVEICNPKTAKDVLEKDISISMAMPCRIAVYSENNITKIGTVKPTAMLVNLSGAKDIQPIAEKVEQTMLKIVDEAK